VKVGENKYEYTVAAGNSLADVVTGINTAAGKVVAAADGTTGINFNGAGIVAGENVAATFYSGDIAKALETIDKAIADVTKGSATLGANKALLETQEEFIGVLTDSLTAGVSAFVDADMNEASTRNQALQTQQQLGVQALSMANQNSQMILKLFQ
jgi:flagellin